MSLITLRFISLDYEVDDPRVVGHSNAFIPSSSGSGMISDHYQHQPRAQLPNIPNLQQYQSMSPYPNSSLERRGSYQAVHYNNSPSHHSPFPNQKPPNCYPDFSPVQLPHPTDYNTIYIRDKLYHDTDIPESCV